MFSINPLTLKWWFETIMFWTIFISFIEANAQNRNCHLYSDGDSHRHPYNRETMEEISRILKKYYNGLCDECKKELNNGYIIDKECSNTCIKNLMYETWKVIYRLYKIMPIIVDNPDLIILALNVDNPEFQDRFL
jgi:hypothetical protein